MKKVLLVGLLIGLAHAGDNSLYDNSVALHIGYESTKGDKNSYSNMVYNLQINRNLDYSTGMLNIDAVQLDLEYATPGTKQRDYVLRGGANALWYMETMSEWTPYVKGGLGLQALNGTTKMTSGDYAYGTVGAGVEYQIRGDASVVGEVSDHLSFAGENTARIATGLKYSFGQSY